MRPLFKLSAIALFLAASFSGAQAAPYRMQDAASQAVLSHPEVLNKWHQFKASGFERNVSWGRYLPTLDLLIGTARQRRESPTLPNNQDSATYNFYNAKLTLRQNLFEGLATLNDVKRLEHASLVRFYEMLDLSETAAFEATKAYIDVWRFRQLVTYAEESYAVHRILYEKIKERAESGVGRKVDLETAAGRLALSESNLLTESSNLHDVTARFQRIVGMLPPAEIEPPPSALLGKDFPKDRLASITLGLDKSPSLKASYENILSAIRNVKVQRANYMPRVDAYAETMRDTSSKGQGYDDYTTESTLGLTATWNLFNGLRDKSRIAKTEEEKLQAKALREKVCRDVRQNSATAFNDVGRLTEQLPFLDQHQLSTDKAREAFRRQFDIGQRTLLDVLDTENEYYTARRNFLNGEADLLVAKAKYHSAAGNLLNILQLKNLEMDPPAPETTPEEDMLTACPAEPVNVIATDKESVFKRAQAREELIRGQATPAPQPAAPEAAKPKAAPTKVKPKQ